jgi:excisionase family DNA binding protein
MQHRIQFGMRENPASDRRHGSRLAVTSLRSSPDSPSETPEANLLTQSSPPSAIQPLAALGTKVNSEATGGENGEKCPLLTIKEVAALLRVPVSWVYGRTRNRALGRIPGYRLGKYWRFSEAEVLAWVKSQRGGSSAS